MFKFLNYFLKNVKIYLLFVSGKKLNLDTAKSAENTICIFKIKFDIIENAYGTFVQQKNRSGMMSDDKGTLFELSIRLICHSNNLGRIYLC